MTKDRFNFLVNEVIVQNGNGHKLLSQMVESKEISKLEETKVLIVAQLAILIRKVEAWCDRLE